MDTHPHTPSVAVSATSATRHLAAAAYLDRRFRRNALTKVYNQRQRDVAPSPGFDPAIVMAHCLRAHHGALVRDLSIVLVLGTAVVSVPRHTLDVAMCLALMHLLVSLGKFGGWLLADSEPDRDDDSPEAMDGARARAYLLKKCRDTWSAKAFMIGYAVVFGTLTGLIILEIGLSLRTGRAAATTKGMSGLRETTTLFVAIFGVCALWAAWRQHQVSRLAVERPYLPIPGAVRRHPKRFDHLRADNTTTHSNYKPFVGSGHLVARWSFAGRLLNGEAGALAAALRELNGDEAHREFKGDLPFTAEQLLARLRRDLNDLASEPSPEKQIPGIEVHDHIYVPASETSRLRRHTDTHTMEELVRRPVEPARHYLVCQVVAWSGELVTTVFLHVAVQGATMYLECTTTALLPCKEEYRPADRSGGSGAIGMARALVHGVTDTPRRVALAPFHLLQVLADGIIALSRRAPLGRRWAQQENYGVEFSVREYGQVDNVELRSQMQDVSKYEQIVERRIFACILDFLVEHKVDTEEFRQRQAMVLNAGVVNATNGVVNVSGHAVGHANSMPQQPAAATT